MKLISVAAAVLNQTPLDWHGNRARIGGAIQAARETGVSILCLPELCITGYGCEDAFHAPGTQQMALDV
ncbi:MAG TPA: nitrilase-related carbon-nitrogen hydrolase, partial [Pirellulaceae bacterium]|nr:nitrilase-related carbon-nitrogen hydrolase [Pirellulaceae bacterium]